MNFKLLILILLLSLIGMQNINAQKVLMEEEVKVDSIKDNFGPNLKHYLQFFIEYGLIIPHQNPEAFKQKIYSPSTGFGLRYKYRFCNTFSVGLSGSFILNTKRFDYFNQLAVSSDSILEDDFYGYKLEQGMVGLSPFIRFNFGRRGNNLGKYFDLGAFYNLIFSSKEIIIFNNQQDLKTTLITNYQKNVTPKYSYGLSSSVGYKKLNIFARVEVRENFDQSSLIYGPTTIGLQLGF